MCRKERCGSWRAEQESGGPHRNEDAAQNSRFRAAFSEHWFYTRVKSGPSSRSPTQAAMMSMQALTSWASTISLGLCM